MGYSAMICRAAFRLASRNIGAGTDSEAMLTTTAETRAIADALPRHVVRLVAIVRVDIVLPARVELTGRATEVARSRANQSEAIAQQTTDQ